MYVRRTVRIAGVVADSWRALAIVVVWTAFLALLRLGLSARMVAMPVLPISVVGIAVSLFLGIKSKSAYDRWWEARQSLGALAALSRTWAMLVNGLSPTALGADEATIRRDLIYRHVAAMYAFAVRMRRSSRLSAGGGAGIFLRRRLVDPSILLSTPEAFRSFLPENEYAAALAMPNACSFLLTRQSAVVQALTHEGRLNLMQQDILLRTLGEIVSGQGRCERIKTTPFPRQIAWFGTLFTWIYVLLVPPGLLDTFLHESMFQNMPPDMANRFVAIHMVLGLVIAWVFVMMERISDSTEDPFEGGVHDVPLSSTCRMVEIELRASLGETELPPRLEPVDDVMY